ncbi:unnamed protein product [Calypogeia fissa]
MEKEGVVPSFKLNTGALMPAVALGLSALGLSSEETKQYILKALEIGYRSVDTAKFYNTESSVGEALQEAFSTGLVKREEVFVTTKIFVDDMDPPSIIPAMQRSLSELKLEYADLILVHWPIHLRTGAKAWDLQEEDWLPLDLVGCWKELEKGVELGLTKAIGVSNFSTKLLKEIETGAKTVPALIQMEMHPGCEITKLREYCNQKGIHVTAWSPLGAPGYGSVWGTNEVLDNPILKEIAEKHGKTVAQVDLRWILDKGVGLTVKSSNPGRLAQNLNLSGWTLSPEDHEKIKAVTPFRIVDGSMYFKFANSPYKCPADLWDDY